MANITFKVLHDFYIISDFTEESLNKISTKLIDINRSTGSNECNFYDLVEFITFENIKHDIIKEVVQKHYGIEFIKIEIDSDIHNISNKRKIHINTLDTFKGIYLNVIITSKNYEIESNEEGILKLKGLEKEIDLNIVKYKYVIN